MLIIRQHFFGKGFFAEGGGAAKPIPAAAPCPSCKVRTEGFPERFSAPLCKPRTPPTESEPRLPCARGAGFLLRRSKKTEGLYPLTRYSVRAGGLRSVSRLPCAGRNIFLSTKKEAFSLEHGKTETVYDMRNFRKRKDLLFKAA